MKIKLLFAAMILIVASCSSPGNTIISQIEKECNTSASPEKLGDGSTQYLYNLDGKSYVEIEAKSKGIIDKTLNQVGKNTSYQKKSGTMDLFNSYEWETPNIRVKMEIAYMVASNNNKSKLRIIILEK